MSTPNSIKHLVRAACRALLATPDLEPKIDVQKRGMGFEVEIDLFPYDFGTVVGERGSMKLAIQSVLSAAGHPEAVKLFFANTGKTRPPQNRKQPPNAAPLQEFMTAAINHWRAIGFEASGEVELSKSAGIVLIECDPKLADAQRAPFLRVCRGIGRAHGFKAMAYIEKMATK